MPRRTVRRRPSAPPPAASAFDPGCSCHAGWQAFRAALAAAARDDEAEAERLSLEAARREPRLLAPVALLRGRLLLRRGELDAAIALLRAGVRITPAAPLLHVSLGHALMLRGDYQAGWKALEWRRRVDFGAATFFPPMPGPEWHGEKFDGTLLVRAEQGMGDCIMFARYLPAVARRVGRVVLACHRPLVPLLAMLPGVGEARRARARPGRVRPLGVPRQRRPPVRHDRCDHPLRRRLPAGRPRPPRRLGPPPPVGTQSGAGLGRQSGEGGGFPAARSSWRR